MSIDKAIELAFREQEFIQYYIEALLDEQLEDYFASVEPSRDWDKKRACYKLKTRCYPSKPLIYCQPDTRIHARNFENNCVSCLIVTKYGVSDTDNSYFDSIAAWQATFPDGYTFSLAPSHKFMFPKGCFTTDNLYIDVADLDILNILARKPLSLHDVITQIHGEWKGQVIRSLSFLIFKGYVIITDYKYSLSNEGRSLLTTLYELDSICLPSS